MGSSDANAQPAALEDIAMLALEFGRILMECGASANVVDGLTVRVAQDLGAERVDLRIGYASLAINVSTGTQGRSRMCKVGPLGVNQRLDAAVREVAHKIQRHELSCATARVELDRVVRETPRHPGWFVAVAVGIACAAFGRLLGADWLAVGPIFVAATVGQSCRRQLHQRQANVFITTIIVSFLSSVLGGLGARWLGSTTVDTAMVAAVLLLVPGVPSLNAQCDILDGRPTLGSARAVWVVVIIVFLTAGLWLSQSLLGMGH